MKEEGGGKGGKGEGGGRGGEKTLDTVTLNSFPKKEKQFRFSIGLH